MRKARGRVFHDPTARPWRSLYLIYLDARMSPKRVTKWCGMTRRNLRFVSCALVVRRSRFCTSGGAKTAEMGPSKSFLTPFAIVLWGFGIASCVIYAWKYESTSTDSHVAHEFWPEGSTCTLASDRATLVMFVHPRCPCSRASLEELAVLMTHCQNRLNVQIVFFKPRTFTTDWARTDLWESAARMPGVVPRVDSGGDEQQRFRARVSGEVFVYLPSGRLLFHGGITGGRGHVGENAGRTALESFLLRGEAATRTTPVFGCSLETPESASCNQRPTSDTKSVP